MCLSDWRLQIKNNMLYTNNNNWIYNFIDFIPNLDPEKVTWHTDDFPIVLYGNIISSLGHIFQFSFGRSAATYIS